MTLPVIMHKESAKELADRKYISFDTQRGRYKVQLNINLGNFDSLSEAKVARDAAIEKIKPWLAKNKIGATKKLKGTK